MPTQAEINEGGRSLSLSVEEGATLRAIAIDRSWPLHGPWRRGEEACRSTLTAHMSMETAL